MKARLWFLLEVFYGDVFTFHKLSIAQLDLNSSKILITFKFLYNNNIEATMTIFSQLY